MTECCDIFKITITGCFILFSILLVVGVTARHKLFKGETVWPNIVNNITVSSPDTI